MPQKKLIENLGRLGATRAESKKNSNALKNRRRKRIAMVRVTRQSFNKKTDTFLVAQKG